MARSGVPVQFDAVGEWVGGAPDPLTNPALYEGVVLKRVLAYLVDVVAIFVIMVVAWIVLGLMTMASFGLLLPLTVPGFPIVLLGYHTLLIGAGRSATLGMMVFNLEVRAWNGRRPTYAQAFLVTLVFYVSMAITSGLILVIALFNDRRRLLHDLLCGTVVVSAER